MHDPLAYFLTISTYGTWLPGDQRGWIEHLRGWQLPKPIRELESIALMKEDACLLTPDQRMVVERQIVETCLHRGWTLHASNCRSNHLHVVLSALETEPKKIRRDIKAWCTRRLKQQFERGRGNWWAERGSIRFIWDEAGLERVVQYVLEAQDLKHLDQS